MSLEEVICCLVRHGCTDLSSDLELSLCSESPIARGGFGAVYRGLLKGGRAIAIKCIEDLGQSGLSESGHKNFKRIARELYAWTRVTHPGILRVLGFARFRDQIALITPWMNKGSLKLSLAEGLDASHRIQLCIQVAHVLEHLHSHGVVHGDVKPDNIILSDDSRVQLADFGSAILTEEFSLCFTRTACVFTPRFAAPELLDESSEHTTKTDIYALGMTILSIFTGKMPFHGRGPCAIIMEVVFKKNRPPRSELPLFAGDEQLWGLLERCWAHQPEDRPTAVEVSQILLDIGRRLANDSGELI